MPEAFRLEGSSMHPVFKPGQVVLVQPLRPSSSAILSSGDCAVYSYKGRTLLHRVVKAGPGGVWFSDDSGRIAPHLVGWELVRGRVVGGNFLSRGFCGLVYSRLRRTVSKVFLNV
jgi:hypothetical protein